MKNGNPSLHRKPAELPQPSTGGAAWYRLDLHLHSPSVSAFAPPKGTKHDEGGFTDAYVDQLAAQGISIAAITDYNGINIEWFEVAAAKAINRGITIFPGVEMTFGEDLHLLAVFSGDTDLRDLNAFLRSLDKDPLRPLVDGSGGHRDIDLKTSLTDAFKELRNRFSCLLILPHPDQANGFCKSLPVEAAVSLLKEIRPDAIECCPEEVRKRLQATGALSADFWDRLASVDFSDAKRIEDIGTRSLTDGTSRSTYVKLGAKGMEALRLALHDPETRLSLGGIPPAVHPRIRSLTISGSGFLGNLSLSLNQDLNVILGDKAAGKSAILECLRYALAIPSYSNRSEPEELLIHALGSDGTVEIILDTTPRERETPSYRIVRAWGRGPRAFEGNSEKPLSTIPADLLPSRGGPVIFGQKEIYAVSESEESRLALLDELIGEEARLRRDALEKAMEPLHASARAILDTRTGLKKQEEYGQRLKKIEKEIELQEKQAAAKLREAADLRSAGEVLQNTADIVKTNLGEYDNRRQNLLNSLETAHRNLCEAHSAQTPVQQEGATVLAVLQESLKVVLDDERTLFEQTIHSLTRLQVRCQEKLHALEEENRGMEQGGVKDLAAQDRLLNLTEERTSLASLIADLDGDKDHMKTLRQERQELLQRVRECRSLQYRLRKEKTDLIAGSLKNHLHIQVEFKGLKERYREELTSVLKDANLSREAIERLVAPEGTDGMTLAQAVRKGSKEIQKSFGLTPEMADRLVHWLTEEESRLFELETLIPQDALRLELRVDDQYRSIGHLSTGQVAAAVLLLLFGLENRIFVIDQPEDYIEDPSSRRELLQILREQKGLKNQDHRRQIIFTTTDATLPVEADAELVIPLEARDDRVHVLGQASIDDRSMRQIIETLLPPPPTPPPSET